MVIVPGPTQFMMGSPPSSPDLADDERWHSERLRHSYCLADCETTVEQFDKFLRVRAVCWRSRSLREMHIRTARGPV